MSRDINFQVIVGGQQPIWQASQNQDGRGYTMSDLRAMKHQPGGQMFRFWTRNPDGGLSMTEGEIGAWHVSQGRSGTTVAIDLYSVRQIMLEPEAIFELCTDAGALGPLPIDCVPYNMVTIEGGNLVDGFQLLGYAGPKDVELESNTVLVFDGHNAWVSQERCEVTIQSAGALADILGRRPNW